MFKCKKSFQTLKTAAQLNANSEADTCHKKKRLIFPLKAID